MAKLSNTDRYDYGLGLLKILMCFEVICCHFWVTETPVLGVWGFYHLRPNAVPVFMLISFYFFAPRLVEHDVRKLGKRMKRLLVPYIGWAVLYFLFLSLMARIGFLGSIPTLADLGRQLLAGSTWLNTPFWYMADLIVLTPMFFLIFRFNDRRISYVLVTILTVAAYIFQYTGANLACFGGLPNDFRYTLGRFTEVIPYATMGTVFGIFGFPKIFRKYWVSVCLISAGIVILLLSIDIDDDPGFGYGGFLLLAETLLIFLIFKSIPWQSIDQRFLGWIPKVGRYTSGIYCTHYAAGLCMNVVLRNTLGGAVADFVYGVRSYFHSLLDILCTGRQDSLEISKWSGAIE